MAKTQSRPSSTISVENDPIIPRYGSGRWRKGNKMSGTRYKVCLSGKFDVGKTSIFMRLQDMEFSEEKPTCQTLTYEFKDKDDETIEYSIWDTNGFEERDTSTMGDHYRNAHCIIFVYDTSDFTSLEYLEYELESIEKNQYAPNTKFILIQNKIDIKPAKLIPYEQQKEFISNSKLRNKIDLFWQTSAKTSEGIKELFDGELQELLTIPDREEKQLTAFDRFIAESTENVAKIKGKKKRKLKCKTM